MRTIFAVAVLGLAGLCGVAACGASVPATSRPLPSTAPATNASVAREIANIVVGKGGLSALDHGDGQAASAYCNPSTVSHPPNVSTSTSAWCGINYADGSVWVQVVTVTFDSRGNPVADFANLGTDVSQPTDGQLWRPASATASHRERVGFQAGYPLPALPRTPGARRPRTPAPWD